MKDYKILFPNEPFDRKNVDSAYLEEFVACRTMGIGYYFYDYEELVDNGKFVTNINSTDKGTLIYRGWMLKPEQYSALYNGVLQVTNGYLTLVNSPKQYENCHCFPSIYKDIEQYTPKIVVSKNTDIINVYGAKKDINFDFFIKDYVKSVKTENGVERLSKDIKDLVLYAKTQEFIGERGSLFTGGLVFKEFVDLKKVDGKTSEWRAFYFYGELLDLSNNSDGDNKNTPPKEFIKYMGSIVAKKSNFFTIDVAHVEKCNRWVIIETGDGGVSGLSPQCNAFGFYNKLFEI